MSSIAEVVLKSAGNVDIQVGGPGNEWVYLSPHASMSGPTVSYGAIETRWAQDPTRSGHFVRSVRFRTNPDDITFDLMTKLTSKDKITQLLCPFGLRSRFLTCSDAREDPSQYQPIMLAYSPAELEEKSYEDLVIKDAADNDEIIVTTPVNAAYEYIVEKMTSPTRMGSATSLGAEAIVSIQLCGNQQCAGSCGKKKDGCDTLYILTQSTTGIYATPNLIIGTKNLKTGVWTWESKEITGLTGGSAEALRCAGDRLILISNDGSEAAYSDDTGDSWTSVALSSPPTQSPNALFVRTAREIWVAAEGGYVFKSTDGGLSYTATMSADAGTTQNLNAVFAYDEDLVWVAGNAGAILVTKNGGTTWTNKTDVLNLDSPHLLDVRVPNQRKVEVYVAVNDGRIFRSIDDGVTFEQVTFSGSGAGSVDKLLFTGPYAGEIMFILHTDASNRTRLLRDNSGGAGGADVELVYNYSDVITAGVALVDMTVCGINEVFLGGAVNAAYPTLIDAS